jgi:hydrogenase-4 membrane subunit HyfE
MTDVIAWSTVALGLVMLVSRRRSVCIVLMSMQSALVGGEAVAVAPGRSTAFVVAAAVLVLKTAALTFFLTLAVRRTREAARVRASIDPLARLTATLIASVLAMLLMPRIDFLPASAQQASIALLTIGGAMVVMRRATILQLVGLLVCENALALAAVSTPGGLPVVIELGAAFHLALLLSVGLAFHRRIYVVLGSGDSALLRELRD